MSKKAFNKSHKKHLTIIVVLLFAIVGVTILVFSKAATPPPSSGGTVGLAVGGTSRYTLTPATGTYAVNAIIPLTVKVSTSDNVNTVVANLTYNDNQLDFMSIDTSGGTFTDCIRNRGGSGVVSINCGLPGTTATGNDLKVAIVNFKVTATGSSTISMASTSAVYKDNAVNVWDGATIGANYTLGTTTTPPTNGGGGGTTTPTTGGGGATTPTTGTSGGSKSTPKTSTPPTSGGGGATIPPASTDNSNSGTFSTDSATDGSSGAAENTATTTATPKKIDTNTIIIYAAVIGGAVAILSASGVAFSKIQRRNRFNRAHGISNSAVVFDANSSVHSPQTNSINQGPMAAPPAPTPSVTTKGPEGNIITPNNKTTTTPL